MLTIRVEKVSFTYPGGVLALNEVSFSVPAGQKVALIGQNGSGKSTLARHLNGLLRPQHGRVWIGDWDTHHHTPAQMARRTAYAFQNPDDQLFHQQVWGEVAFGPRNLGYSPERVKMLVEETLGMFGLTDYANVNPRDLGLSVRKRIALAAAVAMDTPILVFDEPTCGLDAAEETLVKHAIFSLHQNGKTILVISHDMDFLAETCDRFILMKDGKILLDADFQTFFSQDDLLRTAGLIPPQMARLSQRIGLNRLAANPTELVQIIQSILTDK